MKRTTAVLAAIASWAVCSVYADYSVSDRGTWPKSWPKGLAPLRKHARTLEGPEVLLLRYEISFADRAQFESAWPHLLKVKSKGAPIILVRGPYTFLGANIKAGAVVHAPPAQTDQRANPEVPLPGQRDPRATWMWTTFLELVVDGEIVDLNRIPLPADTPIIDERFQAAPKPSPRRGGGQRGT
jgi:hypothetical protein